MPKRPGSDHDDDDPPPRQHVSSVNVMGEFEDAWEDEIESESEIENENENESDDANDANDANRMDVDNDASAVDPPHPPSTYIPGRYKLSKDEILEPDHSVYLALHAMDVNWSCLSFDVLRDNLGDERARFPATCYVVTGTQADVAKNNELLVMKMSQLHSTQHDGADSDASDDGDDADDDNVDDDAVLEYRSIPHVGGVNRVRAQPMPVGLPLPPVAQPYYVATWADTGKVHIHDVRPLVESLAVPGSFVPDTKARSAAPVFTIPSHRRAEGFAMDWAASPAATTSSSSAPSALRLLTGDLHAKIFLTTTTPHSFMAHPQPFTGHTRAVEDLQWSPTEPTVFASCSSDASIRVWDARVKGRRSSLTVKRAHASDVNVINWNRNATYLLLSGGDDGGLNVWDLRSVKESESRTDTPSPVASFAWHRAPVTSVEWHPGEESVFAASGADDQVTLWDLAVEQDADAGDGDLSGAGKDNEEVAVPPQLLFVHQGQKEIKELHWHPQIPGAVITTAYDGFNFFKTISV